MAVQLTESVIIKGTAAELFDMWSDLEFLPSVIDDIKEVHQIDELRSQWTVKGPLGKDFSWIAEITRFEEDRRIAWRTLEGDIKTSGQVTFKDLPQDANTEMTVTMQYVPPAGKIGEVASKILEGPRGKLSEGLHDFKKYAESSYPRAGKFDKDRY
jgi:uncharacterized membrane protein